MDFFYFTNLFADDGPRSSGEDRNDDVETQRNFAIPDTSAGSTDRILNHQSSSSGKQWSERVNSWTVHLRGIGIPNSISTVPDVESSKSDDSAEKKSITSGTDSETSSSSSSNDGKRRKTGRLRGSQSKGRSFTTSRGRSRTPQCSATSYIYKDIDEKHFDLFSHGRIWTIFGIALAWSGLTLSFAARNTTEFATLETPIYVDANFDEVHEIGMINFKLCFNETYTDGVSGCTLHSLDIDDINDKMFQVARSMAFMAILLGGFMAAFMTATVFWQSINLRPVGLGFLLAYFLQSFTFLFYDTSLCATYKCHVASGTIYSILASFCWLLACIASARMDAFKYRQTKLKELYIYRARSRSLSPKKRSKSRLDRGVSDATKAPEDNIEGHEEAPQLEVHKNGRPGGKARSSRPKKALTIDTARITMVGIQDEVATKAWLAWQSARSLSPQSVRSDCESMYYDEEVQDRGRSRSNSRSRKLPQSPERYCSRSRSRSIGPKDGRESKYVEGRLSPRSNRNDTYSNALRVSRLDRSEDASPTRRSAHDRGTARSRSPSKKSQNNVVDDRKFEL